MRVQVPIRQDSTLLWKKQQGGKWSCQSKGSEGRDLPPISCTRNDTSWPTRVSEATITRHEFNGDNRVESSSSIEQGIPWKQPLPTSSRELDLITSSIYPENDILDEILGYSKDDVVDSNIARVASCGAYDVIALPATECIGGQFDHSSAFLACIDPNNSVMNVCRESYDEPDSNCLSLVSEVIPHPGRTTSQFEQFMDFLAFPEHCLSFVGTKYTQSLDQLSECIVFPERYLGSDNKLNNARLIPKNIHLSSNGRDHDLGEAFENVENGCYDGTCVSSMKPRRESRVDTDYERIKNEGAVGRDLSSPISGHADQTSDNVFLGILQPVLEHSHCATNKPIQSLTNRSGIDPDRFAMADSTRVEDADRHSETHDVRSTRSLLSDTTSVSRLSCKPKTEMRKPDWECAGDMGMELVLVSKGSKDKTKDEKNFVQRFFSTVHRPNHNKGERY